MVFLEWSIVRIVSNALVANSDPTSFPGFSPTHGENPGNEVDSDP